MTGREELEKSLIDISKIADNYQSRIELAIKYIEKTRNTLLLSYPPKEAFDIDKLLDILKGGDKDE